jgi:hypothetical protein
MLITAPEVSVLVDSSTWPHASGPLNACIAEEEVTTYGFSPVWRTSESPSSLTMALSSESTRDTRSNPGYVSVFGRRRFTSLQRGEAPIR